MRVEFYGGPLDGQVTEVPDGVRVIDFPVVIDPVASWANERVLEPTFDKIRYEISTLGNFALWPPYFRS